MYILTANQMQAWDKYTIENEPIASIALMERASKSFVTWFTAHYSHETPVYIFCGKGNNGGDGLAIARLLSIKAYSVQVFIVNYSDHASPDFLENEALLARHLTIQYIHSEEDFPKLSETGIVIDALLGTGLTRPTENLLLSIIEHINAAENTCIAVDIASGLPSDGIYLTERGIIRPTYTITFQAPKKALVLPENEVFVGEWFVVDIGLDPRFLATQTLDWEVTMSSYITVNRKKRSKYAHKGTFGHALLVAGSYGKIGAALLAGKACLRAGAGLLTINSPSCGYSILQTALPEAMVISDTSDQHIIDVELSVNYSAIGIGPGLGTHPDTKAVVKAFLSEYKGPLVLDADALNLIANDSKLLNSLPYHAILTPHPKEWKRIVGEHTTRLEAILLAQEFAHLHQVYIVLKGAHTTVICPNGKCYFNTTGNPGMAKGGSGDVLTGIITALLAQGYSTEQAARIGVYLHGQAADQALKSRSETSLLPSDIIDHLR